MLRSGRANGEAMSGERLGEQGGRVPTSPPARCVPNQGMIMDDIRLGFTLHICCSYTSTLACCGALSRALGRCLELKLGVSSFRPPPPRYAPSVKEKAERTASTKVATTSSLRPETPVH
jgi:hypothetical protein